uniref:Uncharacterized protein n=1 Tax=Ascaris lumbricoides TaxID=6252 RepID=A0A9J2PI04_ASCLU
MENIDCVRFIYHFKSFIFYGFRLYHCHISTLFFSCYNYYSEKKTSIQILYNPW